MNDARARVLLCLPQNAVSLYCRLGFAVKKDAVPRTAAGQPVALHPSWADADEMTQSRPRHGMGRWLNALPPGG